MKQMQKKQEMRADILQVKRTRKSVENENHFYLIKGGKNKLKVGF